MRVETETPEVLLQFGYPKSGNYALYSVIKAILSRGGRFRSYRVGRDRSDRLGPFSTVPDALEIDSITLQAGRLYLVVPDRGTRKVEIENVSTLLDQSSLLWTHDVPTEEHLDVLSGVDEWLYVYRDGRDVINSMMHYVVTPEMRRRNPDYQVGDVDEIYADYDFFAKHVGRWRDHVRAALGLDDRLKLVRFEDFIERKRDIVAELLDILAVDVSIEAVMSETSLERMKQRAPSHVRKGKVADWKSRFDDRHRRIFKETAGELLVDLGYQQDMEW